MTDTTVESTTVDNSTEAKVEATVETKASPPALKELLSEELREIKALKNYETVDSMAKSLLSAQEMVGKRVTDLSADELKTISKKFGVPETIEGYEFEADETFKTEALELGLNHEQAMKLHESIVTKNTTAEREAALAAETAMEDFTKSLEDTFGSKMEARIDLARKAALELGGEELEKAVFKEGEPGDLKIIKALSEAGKRLLDHESVATEGAAKFGLTPSEAENEIALLKNNPEFRSAYTSRDDATRKAATDKLAKLYEIAYPS